MNGTTESLALVAGFFTVLVLGFFCGLRFPEGNVDDCVPVQRAQGLGVGGKRPVIVNAFEVSRDVQIVNQ